MSLHVPSFAGGVVLTGSADTRDVTEVLEADGYELGPRGALVCASDVGLYVTLLNQNVITPSPVDAIWHLASTTGITAENVIAIAEWRSPDSSAYSSYLLVPFDREQSLTPVQATVYVMQTPTPVTIGSELPVAPLAAGITVTTIPIPGATPSRFAASAPTSAHRMLFVNLGAREGTAPRSAPGLHVLVVDYPSAGLVTIYPIYKWDSLGTGPYGSRTQYGSPAAGTVGTKSQQLHFRGIASYNGYVFGWGFDAADATNGDGACRVMFSNPPNTNAVATGGVTGGPLTWGNDTAKAKTPPDDRTFADTDAIVLGSAGEHIRAGLAMYGKLFFGTDRGLHFVQGYGRDTFITNGATPVMQAYNVVGPHALIEGPDRRMYGVGDQGLWRFDGYNLPEPLFQRVRTFAGTSPGWFDLMWTNSENAAGIPGRTNHDLVWLAVDWTRHQVLVGIPWCNATAGAGQGVDTVILRYHPHTGGFTRQVFAGQTLTAPGYFRRELQNAETRFLAGGARVTKYGPPAGGLPATLPTATLGYYAPFSPDGIGVVERAYLTVSWNGSTALPLVWRITASIDQRILDPYYVTIGPSPLRGNQGDVWLDTSETASDLGNGATARAGVPTRGGFLLKVRNGVTWMTQRGTGRGTRATVPLPLPRVTGARVGVRVETIVASGRFELEGFGINPGEGVPNA